MPLYTHQESGATTERERWGWVAVYQDGTQLHQFDDGTGLFHQFAEIDQSRLETFSMTNGYRTLSIAFEPDMKLIHFYRTAVLENGQVRVRLYIFGYEQEGRRVLQVIMPDDNVILTSDPDQIKLGTD